MWGPIVGCCRPPVRLRVHCVFFTLTRQQLPANVDICGCCCLPASSDGFFQSAGLLVWVQTILLCLLFTFCAAQIRIQRVKIGWVAFCHLLAPFGLVGFMLGFCVLWDASHAVCVRVFRVSRAVGFVQVSLYGAVSGGCHRLRHIQFATPACSYFPPLRGSAKVSSMKTAATCGH